jgi:hypothetical protein
MTGSYVPVGMAIESGRLTMRGPTSVGNAGMRVEDLCQVHSRLGDELLELCNFSDLLEGVDLVLLVAIDSKAGRVIPAVFET